MLLASVEKAVWQAVDVCWLAPDTSNDHAKGAKNFDAVLVLPSISTNQSQLFLDTHSIVIIGIDIIINELAKIMNEK